ncbi:MAG: hypothetical protein WKF47_12400 [Geodermatophilaceae bacterium]
MRTCVGLLAWHERQIMAHLEQLAVARDQASNAGARLQLVLRAYALIAHESHGQRDNELAVILHRGERVSLAEQQLREMIRDLVAEGAKTGHIRDDVAPDELANYCLHALAAANSLPSKAAVAGWSPSLWQGSAPQD